MHERLTEGAKAALIEHVHVIEDVLNTMLESVDESFHPCETCQLKLKDSMRDCQLAEHLRTMRRRLRGWEEEAGGRKRDVP